MGAAASALSGGVHHNLPTAAFTSWTTLYDEPYSDYTTNADTDVSANGTKCVLVGAQRDCSAIELAAFAPAVDVAKVTALNTPHLVRGRNEARWNLCSARR